MAEKSAFHTTSGVGDGPAGGYTAAQMQEFMREFFTHDGTYGIARGRLNEFASTGATSPVAVNTGVACVNGVYYKSDASTNVAIPTPTTATRIDRIVLRYTGGATQTVRITRLAGTEGSGSPPAMTQTEGGTPYDVALYQVSITTGGAITLANERRYARSPFALGISDESTIEYDSTNKVIRVKDAGITSAKLATNAVTTVKITDANVTTAKIADANVTTAKIADGNVTDAKLASGIDGDKITTGTPSVTALTSAGQVKSTSSGNFTGSGIYVESALPSFAWRETDQSADEKIWDMPVSNKSLAIRVVNDANSASTNAITIARGTGATLTGITLGAATSIGGGITVNGNATITGTASVTGTITGNLSGNATTATTAATANAVATNAVDTAGIQANAVTTAKITDANITTAKLADNSVDDTKLGDRVPQFYRRQGGSGTDFNTAGTTPYTPTTLREQWGAISASGSVTTATGGGIAGTYTQSVTFPTAFSAKPIVVVSFDVILANGSSGTVYVNPTSISASGFTLSCGVINGTAGTATHQITAYWRALGPE